MTDTTPATTTAPAMHYRYDVRYYITDRFGSLFWDGTATINQDQPYPDQDTDPYGYAVVAAKTAQVIRDSAPANVPLGRVLVAAVIPAS